MIRRSHRLIGFLIAAVAVTLGAPSLHAQQNKVPDTTSVEVLDQGEAPRRELRYQFAVGQKEKLVMKMDMAMEMNFGARAQSIDMPVVTMGGEIEMTEKTDKGYRMTFKFTDISVAKPQAGAGPPGMHEQMKQQMKQLEGLSGEGVVTDRGRTIDVSYEAPDGAGPQVRQQLNRTKRMMKNLGTILPKQAIGAGGKWRVIMPVDSGQMKLTQTATYTVESMEGDEVELSIAIEQSAPEQQMQQGAQKVTLKQFEGGGEGSAKVNLKRLVSESVLDYTVDVTTQAARGPAVDMTMDMKLDMGPGKGGALN
jgi:hypothetical protein